MEVLLDAHEEKLLEAALKQPASALPPVMGSGTTPPSMMIEFSAILDLTESRVEEILGHGPEDISDLTAIANIARNRHRHKRELLKREHKEQLSAAAAAAAAGGAEEGKSQ
jgi:hypothetical protein